MYLSSLTIPVKKLHELAVIPAYAKEGDAGFDLSAVEKVVIHPGQRALVKTGLAFEIPAGFELQIRPRSGLALKKGITCLNSPGTIDSGYRGEVGVILINHGEDTFVVELGDRIAQGVVNQLPNVVLLETGVLSETERGSTGFGSSGVKDPKREIMDEMKQVFLSYCTLRKVQEIVEEASDEFPNINLHKGSTNPTELVESILNFAMEQDLLDCLASSMVNYFYGMDCVRELTVLCEKPGSPVRLFC